MSELPMRTKPNARWDLACRVAEVILDRWKDDIHAIGVHGSLAHGDDDDNSDVDFVVVTRQRGQGPAPASRRIDGIVFDLGVVSADDYLREAQNLTPSWPLTADQYFSTRAIYDPAGWHDHLRQAHLLRLKAASDAEFLRLAAGQWPAARQAAARAHRQVRRGLYPAAQAATVQAAVATAVTDGLLTRTCFRGTVDALGRTGLLGADLDVLAKRHARQLAALNANGCAVDTSIDQLLGKSHL
jgi:hypothetical protein